MGSFRDPTIVMGLFAATMHHRGLKVMSFTVFGGTFHTLGLGEQKGA